MSNRRIFAGSIPALIGLLAITLAGCAESVSDITVPAPRHAPASAGSALSQAPSRTVRLETFTMRRGTGVLPGRIGERKTVGDISMGLVTVTPTPEELLEQAIEAELTAAGHAVTRNQAETRIGGEVTQFVFGTDVTALYWDAYVDAALSLDVESPRGAVRREYVSRCVERTYSWPSADLIARVVGACVREIAAKFREDPNVRESL